MRKIIKIIKRLIEKVSMDKITHFFAGATIAESIGVFLGNS